MDKKRLTSENGKPIADNQNIQTAGVRGPAMLQDVWYARKTRPLRPGSDPRTPHARQRLGRLRHLHRDARHHANTPGPRSFSQVGKQTDVSRPLLDRSRRARRRRCRARHPRLRHEILHRHGQLGPGRQQHAGLLPARSAEIPRPEPRHQTRSAHRHAKCQQQLGLLDAPARKRSTR